MATKISVPTVKRQVGLEKVNFDEDENVPIASLSLLTGFPLKMIKSELVFDKDFISMRELRRVMMMFLKKKIEGNLKES